MDYDEELAALESVLRYNTQHAKDLLRLWLDLDRLNKLTDALDKLAALVDEEAIRRIPKRTHLSE